MLSGIKVPLILILVVVTGCVTNKKEITPRENFYQAHIELLDLYQQTKLELEESNRLLKISAHHRRIEAFKNDSLNDQNQDLKISLREAYAGAEETKKQLLRKNRILESYIRHIKSNIQLESMQVEIVGGRILLRLPSDILFSSGSVRLSKQGKQDLFEIAKVLNLTPHNRFQIEGHTDSTPVKGGLYKSNWHLGYGRAMSVLKVFQASGIDEARISAASFGEFQPRVDNNTHQNKALNRRIEIVMIPDLSPLGESHGFVDK